MKTKHLYLPIDIRMSNGLLCDLDKGNNQFEILYVGNLIRKHQYNKGKLWRRIMQSISEGQLVETKDLLAAKLDEVETIAKNKILFFDFPNDLKQVKLLHTLIKQRQMHAKLYVLERYGYRNSRGETNRYLDKNHLKSILNSTELPFEWKE